MVTAKSGFTLAEMLVVLVILGLLAVVAPPYVQGAMDRADAQSAADRIAAALAEGRDLAVTRNRLVSVTIRDSAVSVEGGRWRKLPNGVRLTPPAGGRVIFHPDGSSGGGRAVVSLQEQAWLVSVEPLTGQVQRLHAGS